MGPHRARVRIVAPLLVAALLAGACVGQARSRQSAAPPGTIAVEMGTFFFKPATIALTAGQKVTLSFNNPNAIEHDVFAGRQADASNSRYVTDFFTGVDVELSGAAKMTRENGVFRVLVDPLGKAELKFVVPERKGTYEIGCFLPGHYQGGMKGTLIVN